MSTPHSSQRPPYPGSEAFAPEQAAGYYPYYPSGERAGDTMQLKDLLAMVWRGKWIILGAAVLVLTLVGLYLWMTPPQYQAATKLLVHTDQSGGLQGFDRQMEEALGLGKRSINNEVWVLRNSQAISERVARRLSSLGVVPGTAEPLSVLLDDDGARLPDAAVASRLRYGYVKVGPDGQEVDGIQVVATSTVPGEAALIANLYSEEYINRTQEASRARILASRTFLQEQETRMRENLRGLEEQIKDYMSREGAAALDVEASNTVSQIAELEALRDQTRIELEMRRASLATQQRDLQAIQPQLAERVASGVDRELQRVQAQLSTLELQASEMLLKNPDLETNPGRSPEYQSLQQRIGQLRGRVAQLREAFVKDVLAAGGVNPNEEGLAYVAGQQRALAEGQVEVAGLEAKLNTLQQRVGQYEGKMRDIPRQAIELAQLQRARQSTERLYSYLVEKLQEARIAEEAEIGYAEIILPASVPGSPVSPNVPRSLAVGLVLGLMLGVGLVVLRNHFDTRLHHPGELRERGFTVMGVIPNMERDLKRDFAGAETLQVDGRAIDTRLVMLLNPMSPAAEAYRRLRTNVQFARPDTVIETILFTSPDASEGKSTTAINFAVAMAQASRRTIVVDCDLRRPRQHTMLGAPREPGLSGLLFNDPAAFDAQPFQTGVDHLYLIPAGAGVPNPAELLGSKKMRELLARLREEFDLVVLDTPPVLAFSDAMLLATQADATLLVGSANHTDVRGFAHAAEILQGVGATVAGAVLNRFDPRESRGYGYGYGYKYGYYNYGYHYGAGSAG